MNNQNNTQSKEQIKFEYRTLKNINLETVFRFYNWLNEFEPMTESSFLRAWDVFNEIGHSYPCKKLTDGVCKGKNAPECYNTCKFYRNYTKQTKDIKDNKKNAEFKVIGELSK